VGSWSGFVLLLRDFVLFGAGRMAVGWSVSSFCLLALIWGVMIFLWRLLLFVI
jgi:hypothetical protein